MKFIKLSAALIFLLCVSTAPSLSQKSTNCAFEIAPSTPAFAVVDCLQNLAKQLTENEFEIRRLKSELFSIRKLEAKFSELQFVNAPDLPSGAVVAFDLTGGCPNGWSEFSQGAGRFLVGVGRGNETREGEFLTPRTLSETGGTERHTHIANGQQVFGTSVGSDDLGLIAFGPPFHHPITTSPASHLPPYVALHFCKKI